MDNRPKVRELKNYMRELLDKFNELYLDHKDTKEVLEQLKVVTDELVALRPKHKLYKEVHRMVTHSLENKNGQD